MRLWARLALILASVALLSVAVVGGLSSRIASQQAMADSQDDLRREAHLHAEVIGRWLTDQQAHAEAWNQVFVGQVQAMDDTKRSGFLAGVYRGTPAAVVVVMVDGTGQPVVPATYRASADERPAGSPERADALLRRLPIREALQRGSASGTPWIADPAARVPSVPMAVLVANGATAEDALLLGLELQLEGAFDMVERIEPGHGVALFGPAGEPIIGAGQPLLDVDLLQPLLQKDADFRYGTGRDEVMGSMVPVPYTDWSAVVLEPAWQVGATARSIRGSVVGSAVMAVLLATVWAFLAATRISGPVSRLRDAALDLAAGKRTGIETVERSDEIGELGRAFQHMAEQLASQRDAIEQFNRELQDRVDERTRELELAQSALIRSGQLAAVAEVGAGLAHELNNPLSSVLGLAQVLQAQHPDDPVLRDLGGEAERCREVVQALLRFTSGEVDPHDAPVIDLRDALSERIRLDGRALVRDQETNAAPPAAFVKGVLDLRERFAAVVDEAMNGEKKARKRVRWRCSIPKRSCPVRGSTWVVSCRGRFNSFRSSAPRRSARTSSRESPFFLHALEGRAGPSCTLPFRPLDSRRSRGWCLWRQ